MMGLVEILESKGIPPHPDATALTSSQDKQSNHYTPQLVFAIQWLETDVSKEDTVQLMGWTSLGKHTLGVEILGMCIVTEQNFCS